MEKPEKCKRGFKHLLSLAAVATLNVICNICWQPNNITAPSGNSRCWGKPLSGFTADVSLPSRICSSADSCSKGKERPLSAVFPGDAASGFSGAHRIESAHDTISTQTLGVVSSCWAPLDFTPPKVWCKAHKTEPRGTLGGCLVLPGAHNSWTHP